VSFDEPYDDSSSCPILDLKVINRSTSTIIVKRVDIHVQAVWKVPGCYKRDIRDIEEVTDGILDSSASYDLTIPDRAPPFLLSQRVSHVLQPNEADRFRIGLHRPAFGKIVVLSMVAKVVYGSESSEELSGELLCSFRSDSDELDRWRANAQRTYAQVAHEIRERRGHMSKRLFELLEEMEAGGG